MAGNSVKQRRGRPFRPGQSGNPTGRPKKNGIADDILRAACPEAARRLVELMDSPNEKTALQAANSILDRVNGRAVSVNDINIGTERGTLAGIWLGDLESPARAGE